MSSTTPTPKQKKRIARKRLVSPQNQLSDDQTPVDMQQAVSQKLYALLHVVMDLSTRVAAFEERQDQGEAVVTVSPPPSPPRRRAGRQATPAPYDEIAPEVRRRVAERMRRATPLNLDTEDRNTSDDEEHLPS